VDENALHHILKELPNMAAKGAAPDDADNVLEELQKAVEQHERILARQAELIKRLRAELKGVK
jgi:hypothetical protein